MDAQTAALRNVIAMMKRREASELEDEEDEGEKDKQPKRKRPKLVEALSGKK